MKCTNCGAPIEAGSIFCPHCGTKQTAVNAAPAGGWFSAANNLDDSPVETSYTPPVAKPAEPSASSAFIKPVKGVNAPPVETEYSPEPYDAYTSPVSPYGEPAGEPNPYDTEKKENGSFFAKWGKYLIAAAGAAVAVLALILVFSFMGNSYKTPVALMVKQLNSKKYVSYPEQYLEQLNGFAEKGAKGILKIMKKTEYYEDMVEDEEDWFEEYLEDMEDEYGKNFKWTYKIADKDELDKDDLRYMRDSLRDIADECEWIEEETEDYDSDDWEDLADELEISKSEAKELVECILAIGKECKDAKVTAGYELEVELYLDGSELDEPEEDETTLWVYKVDGRWVSEEIIYFLEDYIYIF